MTVSFKKGDPQLPDNYRPITIRPILHKLFANVLYTRIRTTLDDAQCVDQAGFRSGFSCDDHLQAVVLLVEACSEFNLPLWICSIDFKKAFDSAEHESIWMALRNQGLDTQYIKILEQLYSKQVGFITFATTASKPFKIERGAKQGDPLSPALFNSVLEEVLRIIQPVRRRNGYGISLGNKTKDILTNLRFADDLLLLASSEKQVKHMLEHLVLAAREVGMEMHSGKTKVLSNDGACKKRSLRIGEAAVDILPTTESTEYLGQRLSLGELHNTEIEARLDKAWRKFMASKSELCGRHV